MTASRPTQLTMWLHRYASLPIHLSDLPLKVHDRELEASCREVASCLLRLGQIADDREVAVHAMKALAAPLIHWSVARVVRQGGLQDGLLTVHVLNILRCLMHVLQEPVLVFGSFDWECTGQEFAQADSSVAEVAAQQDDDVPVKVAAAEAVAVAGEVARQGACALPTMAAQQSAGLQVLKVVLTTCQNIRKDCRCTLLVGLSTRARVASCHAVPVQVFQEQKGAEVREALEVEGDAVKAAQETLASEAHCSEEEAAMEECCEQEAVPEAAQEAARGPAEHTTQALEVTCNTRCSAPVNSNLVYLLSCWLHAELDLLSYPLQQ